MGLDNFSNEDSQATSDTQTNSGGGGTTKKKKKSDPFKRVGMKPKQKVFQTEEDWERTVEWIENKLGYGIDEVLNWPTHIRHKALHRAIIKSKSGEDAEEFNIHRKCFVCDYEYSFPHDWDYEEYKGETVCGEHEFAEVKEAYIDMQN